ncbi:DMT family transporter [Thiotrichales bacterium 19S11-10]|nr:DMT family transporter [Thiotrichales bacterium 19S11-10]
MGIVFGYLMIILCQLSASINVVGSKHLLSSLDVFFLMETRFLIAAVILFIAWLLVGKKNRPEHVKVKSLSKSDWSLLIFQALCAGAFFNLLMLLGMLYTSANNAAIITSAIPAMVALLSVFILKQVLTRYKFICIAFATIGLFVINGSKFNLGGSTNALFGDLLIVIAIIPEALYFVISKIRTIRLPVLLLSSIINAINAIFILPFLLLFPSSIPTHVSGLDWSILLLVGLSSGLFYIGWAKGCQYVDGATAGVLTALMPIFAIILSIIFLGEVVGTLQIVGMLLILLSIIFSNMGGLIKKFKPKSYLPIRRRK